ncbi:MAG: hypothetical protein M3Q06_00710 [Bacteroidota bacterium]|nr:hypothetical protein [Bacteroidota bacterium]
MSKRIQKVSVQVVVAFAALVVFMNGHTAYCADSTTISLKKNIVFGSFGGKENFGSVNYEHIFSTSRSLNWSFSIGVQPFNPSRRFSVPLSINAFTKGRLHHLEVDVTATFYMDKFHPYNNTWQEDFNKQIYVTPFLCYRLQGSRGLLFKTGIGPQLVFDPPSKDILAVRTRVLKPSFFGALGISF